MIDVYYYKIQTAQDKNPPHFELFNSWGALAKKVQLVNSYLLRQYNESKVNDNDFGVYFTIGLTSLGLLTMLTLIIYQRVKARRFTKQSRQNEHDLEQST